MNPTINFRLSPQQLARGLQIIRNLEPTYKLISPSKIVKTIYFDYLAKMTLNKSNSVPQKYLEEINLLLENKNKKNIKDFNSLKTFIQTNNQDENNDEKSVISSVEDFSPPEDWED